MILKEYDIRLNIKRSQKQDYIEVVQGDYETNIFNIQITDNLEPYNLTGLSVEIAFAKPDNTTVLQDEDNGVTIEDAEQGKIKVVLKTNTIAAAGKVYAEVRIKDGDMILTTARFDFFVRRAIFGDDTIKSKDEWPLYEQLLEAAENENERIDNENTRIQNETQRENQEIIRQQNEQDRTTAESARNVAESDRQTNEQSRINNESIRQQQESDRMVNEQERINAEEQRISAESERLSAENERISREQERIENENTRVANEAERQLAEQERINAENMRISNETTRQSNEQARINAELERQTNEQLRREQEDYRQASIADIENRWNQLTTAQQQDAEVIDARTSTIKEKTFPTLNARLEEIEQDVNKPVYSDTITIEGGIGSIPSNAEGQVSGVKIQGLTATNIIENGNFLDGTSGWGVHDNSTTLSVSNNTLIATGTGNFTNVTCHRRFNANILQTGHKYYVRAIFRVTNSECTRIKIEFRSSTIQEVAGQNNPVANQWYTLSGIITALGTYPAPYVRIVANYPDAATAAGKVTEIREVIAIDLTVHGLENKTKEELDRMFPYYWNGTNSTVCAGRIKIVRKNLFHPKHALKNPRYSIMEYLGVQCLSWIASSNMGSVKNGEQYGLFMDGMFEKGKQYMIIVDMAVSSDEAYLCWFYDDGTYQRTQPSQTVDSFTRIISTSEAGKNVVGIGGMWNAGQRVYVRLDTFQIQKADVSQEYEPYMESNTYFVAKDPETDEILQLRSVPSGAKDEISVTEGKLIKRVSDWINLWELEWSKHFASETENYWCMQNNDMFPNSVISFYEDNITIVNYPHVVIPSGATYEAYDGYAIRKNRENFRIKIPKSEIDGTIDNAKAKAWLQQNQVTLIYQLAEPITYPVNIEGEPIIYPNGTIYIEPYIADMFEYNDGITFDYPVSEIDKIKGIVDGKWVELDNEYTLSEDGLTLTIEGVENGQQIKVYAPIQEGESTIGTLDITVPCNLKAQVRGNMKMAQLAHDKIVDLNDFTVAMLLNHEIRLTTLETMQGGN